MNKIIFTFFFLLTIPIFQLRAGEPLCLNGSTGEPITWLLDKPIPYYTEPDVLGKLTQEQTKELISYAMLVWEDVPTASVQFEFKGYLEQPVNKETYETVYNEFENYKEDEPGIYIIFDNDGTFDEEIWNANPTAVAVTKSIGIQSFWDPDEPITNYQRVLIIIDGRYINEDEEDKNELSVLQITGALVHELGHALGFAHTETNFSQYYYLYYSNYDENFVYVTTMNGAGLNDEGYIVNLNPDDIATISWFYPTSTSVSETGDIYGSVTLLDGTPEPKLQIIARNINDPLCEAFVTYTGYYCTQRTLTCEADEIVKDDCYDETKGGLFQFNNLPPGEYIIEVNEVYRYLPQAISPYYYPTEIPGGAEFWNEEDVADEDPYSFTKITVNAGETVEGINIVLRSSETNIDDEVYLERIPYTFFEENDMPSLPEGESRCQSNTIDYAALIGVEEESGTSTGETTGGASTNTSSSSGGGGCQLSTQAEQSHRLIHFFLSLLTFFLMLQVRFKKKWGYLQ